MGMLDNVVQHGIHEVVSHILEPFVFRTVNL